jgi:hypothetical protein
MQVVGGREKSVVNFTGLTELDTSEKEIFQISHKDAWKCEIIVSRTERNCRVKSITGRMTFATRD